MNFVEVAVAFVLLLLVVSIGWLFVFGDREDAMSDEEPTLNTRGRDE